MLALNRSLRFNNIAMQQKNSNRWFRAGVMAVVITVSLSFLTYYTYDGVSDDGFQLAFNESYGIYALNIPESIDFADEKVPIADPEIVERLDRELLVNTYWQSQTLLFAKRSNRDFQVIEPILKKYGVPDDFKYLAVIESGLTHVVSPAGAAGYWQILKGTAQENGLEVTNEVDERYHLEKSTEAACKYLLTSYDKFNSWTLAAASYNMGRDGLAKQLERQEGSSYYDLLLNSETGRYLFRIMAVKEILENPERHGFHYREKDLYPNVPVRQLMIDTAITDLGAFAKDQGINYRILKYHNPWLRLEYLPQRDGKQYVINIPNEGYFELSPSLEIEQNEIPKSDSVIIPTDDQSGDEPMLEKRVN